MSETRAGSGAVRRTQAERRERMRARLLDAALDCLVERGYHGTTTTLVSQRAGVSRGAQLHHFPTRADLVAAAIEHLFDLMRREYQQAFDQHDGADVAAAVDLLWSMFERPHYTAVLELYVAARTDRELRQRLQPVAQAHQQHVHRLAHQYFPELAQRGALDRALATLLDAMQGMAVARLLDDAPDQRDARLAMLRRIAFEALTASRGVQ